MEGLPYRAAIVDFDRTLLRSDKSISPYAVDVLRRWRRAGGRLFAATARPERAIGDYLEAADFDAVTTLNGARTILPGGVLENPIGAADAEAVLVQLCGIPGAAVTVEAEDGIYSNTDFPLWHPILCRDLAALPRKLTIYKILASHARRSPEELPAALPDGVYSSVADRKLLQIMSRAATKWNGVRDMLAAFGIAAEEAVCFGDDNDDAEPLRRCGRGVAVRNALPDIRASADDITESNDEDGVANYLSRLLSGARPPD